jgi:hypothetical protein
MVVLGQFIFVSDQLHQVSELWRRLLDDCNVLFGLLELCIAVNASNTRLRHPLAVDVSVFDLAFECVPVVELEMPNLRVVRVLEEDWLAVPSILTAPSAFGDIHAYIQTQHTLPVAPQHASRASSITTS